jgi:hypothetical protein
MAPVNPAAEQCPNCQAYLAAGQRYCLSCGARCGEPRLPFMDAVTFMDAMKASPEAVAAAGPQPSQRRMSPNTALFATIGVLLLAMGVGVLIGRSGNHSSTAPVAAAPQVIKVGGTGSEETKGAGSTSGTETIGGSSKKVSKKTLNKDANSQSDTEKVLHSKVPLAEPGTQLGDKCKEGVAGCKGGEFTGEFFGE